MKAVSIFNHVIGPVMRGRSSSHTAGAFHIGAMARALAGGTPKAVVIAFDADGGLAILNPLRQVLDVPRSS